MLLRICITSHPICAPVREQAQSAFERAQAEKAKDSKVVVDPNKAAAEALRMSMSLDGLEAQKPEKRKAPAGDDDEDVWWPTLVFMLWRFVLAL